MANRFFSSFAAAIALGAATLLTVAPAAADAPPTRVAVVDVQRAVSSTEDGLRAQATLKKLFDSKQQELNKKQTELQRQREDLDKQAKSLPKDQLQKRIDDWQKQMLELQQVFLEYNKEIEKEQKRLTEPVLEKMVGIIKRLATSDNIDVVVDKATVAYVRTDLDLTDRCIQMYNAGAKK